MNKQVPFSADSGVWARSAGDVYPYIVYGQETPEGLRWGVMGGGIDPILIGSIDSAIEFSETLKLRLDARNPALQDRIYERVQRYLDAPIMTVFKARRDALGRMDPASFEAAERVIMGEVS